MRTIGIVDYGRGNLASVMNAVGMLGAPARILSRPEETKEVSHVILPGVGAFGEAMVDLNRGGWVEALNIHAMEAKKPFLGICLGMQLIAEKGTEHGDFVGLGWIAGSVTRLSGSKDARIPHIGWNNVGVVGKSSLFDGVESGKDFYFVHSYALRPNDESCVIGWCHHGERFVGAVQQENIYATQFHPEKSQKPGLRVLENFIQC